MQLNLTLLRFEFDNKYNYPLWISITVLSINERSLFYWDNWKTLDLFWFRVKK